MKKLLTIVLGVLPMVLKMATPEILKELQQAVLNYETKAKETPNPWDDMLAETLKALVGL